MNNFKTILHDYHRDRRGDLWTIWNQNEKSTKDIAFNHDKVSVSKKNVLRGIHGDFKSWKLISCLYGKIFFVLVDNRKESKNYLSHKSLILDWRKKKSVLIPPGFGNGFYVYSDFCVFHYKWSYKGKYPDVDKQFTIKWNDKKINIKWPCKKPILQKRDQ